MRSRFGTRTIQFASLRSVCSFLLHFKNSLIFSSHVYSFSLSLLLIVDDADASGFGKTDAVEQQQKATAGRLKRHAPVDTSVRVVDETTTEEEDDDDEEEEETKAAVDAVEKP